jgi:hypothetical protein
MKAVGRSALDAGRPVGNRPQDGILPHIVFKGVAQPWRYSQTAPDAFRTASAFLAEREHVTIRVLYANYKAECGIPGVRIDHCEPYKTAFNTEGG